MCLRLRAFACVRACLNVCVYCPHNHTGHFRKRKSKGDLDLQPLDAVVVNTDVFVGEHTHAWSVTYACRCFISFSLRHYFYPHCPTAYLFILSSPPALACVFSEALPKIPSCALEASSLHASIPHRQKAGRLGCPGWAPAWREQPVNTLKCMLSRQLHKNSNSYRNRKGQSLASVACFECYFYADLKDTSLV